MSVAWSVIRTEIQDLAGDSVFSATGSKFKYLLIWANRVQRNMHKEIDFRHKLKYAAGTISFTGSSPKAMPTDFFKVSDRFIKVRQNASPDDVIPLMGLDRLLELDPGQDDTTSNAFPEAVAIESTNMYSTPLFTGTVDVEGYYTIPTDLSADGSNLDFPDDDDAVGAIIAGVLWRCFRHLKDPDMMSVYLQDYNRLLELLRRHNNKSDSSQITKASQF